MTFLPEMAVNINGDLGLKHWRDQPPTQNLTLDEKREVARRVNAFPKLVAALDRFSNCGLIATNGKTMDSAHTHPELVAALENAFTALREVGA